MSDMCNNILYYSFTFGVRGGAGGWSTALKAGR